MQYLWATVSIHGFIPFQYTLAYLYARQNYGVPKIAVVRHLDQHQISKFLNHKLSITPLNPQISTLIEE